jgi:hypothetical protein
LATPTLGWVITPLPGHLGAASCCSTRTIRQQ